MLFSLVSLLLPTYFNLHDRIIVRTEIYRESRVSLKKFLSVLQFVQSQMILTCVHEMIQVFFIFIGYRFLVEGGRQG